MKKLSAVVETIKDNWDSSKIINAWNERCDKTNDMDSYIEYMDSFDDLMCGKSPMDIAIMVSMGEFHSGDDYYAFNGYGNIRTFSYWDDNDSPIDIYELAEWIIDNGDTDFEVDTDDLICYFVDEYYGEAYEDERLRIENCINELIESEPCDFLTEDWDDLHECIDEYLNAKKAVVAAIDELNGENAIALDEIPFNGENGFGKALGISKDENGNLVIGYDVDGYLFTDNVEVSELPIVFFKDVFDSFENGNVKVTTAE